MSFAVTFATIMAFSFGSLEGWAATLPTQLISQPQTHIATMNQVEAISKNIEGKAQAAIGNITGNPKDQIIGKAKQVESQIRNVTEDKNEKINLRGRTKAVTKNIEGTVKEARGQVTGNRKDQVSGKANKIESQIINTVEDVKDKVQDILN
ncbi:CsbD family protein [Neosynechococcus sphagnicola]|nr:CsbD family protein [Neosynechococcus sphagnicola]